MAKKERKETQVALKADIGRRRQEEDAYVASREGVRSEQEQRSGAIIGGLASTGGFDPAQLDYMRGVGAEQVATGGYGVPELAEARGGYRGLAETGGITRPEEGAMIRRATRGVTSIYDVLSAEAARKRAVTGGYGGGGETARMARQSAEEAAEAATGAEAQIAQIRQTGRIEGVRGLGGLATEEATGRRAALEGYRGVETGVAGGVRLAAQLSVDQQIATGTEILRRIQLGQDVSASDMALLADLSKQPGIFDNIIRAVGAGAGVLAGLGAMGAGGSSGASGGGFAASGATGLPTY